MDALIAATREMVRVLKPSGSIWVNLGDKYVSDNRGSAIDVKRGEAKWAPAGPAGYPGEGIMPRKSLMGIPWRYAIRCIDDLGLILRAEVIWSKPNGLPESVTDRVRRSHEQWFHFTLNPRYYSAVDEVREEHAAKSVYQQDVARKNPNGHGDRRAFAPGQQVQSGMASGLRELNPLGKLPGSVWTIATEPLRVPDHLGIDHFAAFPSELPRRIITGWSPRGVCVECGAGRRPVVSSVGLDMSRPQARRAHELATEAGLTEAHYEALLSVGVSDTGRGKATQSGTGKNRDEVYVLADHARTVLGGYAREYLLRRPTGFTYACDCPEPTAPTTPGVVLDPFGGTGTTALVADALGRHGISVDMSQDYCRLAEWRTNDPKQKAKAARREYRESEPQVEGQESLFPELDVAPKVRGNAGSSLVGIPRATCEACGYRSQNARAGACEKCGSGRSA